VFQNPDNQMIASIVEDDIAFGPENLGVPREEIVERVEGALESVGMSEYHDKTPTKLSGGQKQRIAIAGVLAIRPRVLVLDEATSMLDPQGRKDVMDTVKRLNREGITVVAITHFMDEVTEADRVAVLSEGELVMQGAPREIFKEKDKLHGYGLDVPRSVALSHELFCAGLEIEPAIFDVDELGDEICRLLSDN
jgi:cobalt import ATP-binding protein cbiO 2